MPMPPMPPFYVENGADLMYNYYIYMYFRFSVTLIIKER